MMGQLRREAEKPRKAAVKLMEHAATLIARSAEMEKKVSRVKAQNTALPKALEISLVLGLIPAPSTSNVRSAGHRMHKHFCCGPTRTHRR
jgi:hypothetical protein